MLSTTNQRLKFFVDSLHVSTTEFATEIGTSQSAMSAILLGQRSLSRGMTARIKAHYPKLNVAWLQTGEGDMVVDTQNGNVNQYVGRDGSNYNNSPIFGEVSAMLDVPVSTLRFWEDTFEQLDPFRTPKGTRKYRPEDVEMARLIKSMLRDKGYTVDAVKRNLADYRKCPPRHPFSCKSVDDALRLLSEVKSRCGEDAHAVARIEAVEAWIAGIEIAEEQRRPEHKNIRGKEYFAEVIKDKQTDSQS